MSGLTVQTEAGARPGLCGGTRADGFNVVYW